MLSRLERYILKAIFGSQYYKAEQLAKAVLNIPDILKELYDNRRAQALLLYEIAKQRARLLKPKS